MFNLLPKAEKECIRREYRIRLAIVALWFSLATLLIASVLLLPSLLLSSAKEKAVMRRFTAVSTSVERGSAEKLADVLEETQSRLALFRRKAPVMYLHELLMRMASLKTNRVSFTNISFTGGESGKREVAIAGVAKDRAGLLSFVKSLERADFFEKVDVPISNYAKDTDIAFSLRAGGSF